MTRQHPCASALTFASGALLLLGATACTATEPEEPPALIEVVSQPDYTGEPIPLDAPLHSSGAFEFDQWPSACALTDTATVQAVLPGAVEIAQKAEPQQLKFLDIGPGAGDDSTNTIPEARCTTSAGFDADGLRLEDGNVVMNVTAEVLQAGGSAFLEANHDRPIGKETQVRDATCFVDHTTYTCEMTNIVFTIAVDARPYEQYTHTGGSFYVVDGERIDYSDDFEAFQAMSVEKILEPMVEMAVERLSS